MSKARVLILGKLPPPYMGPAIATSIILNSALKEEFELLHLDTQANTSLSTLGKWSPGKLIRNIGIYFRMFYMLVVARPALVLVPISQSTTGYLKDAVFILLSKLTGRKVLVQLRGSEFRNWLDAAPVFVRWFVRSTLRLTNGVIVLGERLRNLFDSIFLEEDIYVVPNGADYPLQFKIKENKPVRVLYLANLQASKGIEDVLQALVHLKPELREKIKLDVVGAWRKDETRDFCLGLVSREKLPVHFHPPDAGQIKFDMLGEADIFVFTPRAPEGHPWVIVESMAAGLPIISTDRGAIAECVLEGRNGFIVEAQNPSIIAEKLEILINDPKLREQMGRESRKLYDERFTEASMVKNLSRTFNTVLKR